MSRFHAYQTRFTTVRSDVRTLPGWARLAVTVAALPGLLVGVVGVGVLLLAVAVLLVCVGPTLLATRAIRDALGGGASDQAPRPARRPARRTAMKQVRATVIDEP